jgi:hypothetical protein
MSSPASCNLNIEHLRYLGFKPGNCADVWKKYFKRSIWGHCQCCAFPVKVTRLISSIIEVKYYSRITTPPVYFIINPPADNAESYQLPGSYLDADSGNYYAGLTNKQKVELLIPVCYRCWIKSQAEHNYSTAGFSPANPEMVSLLCASTTSLTPDQVAVRAVLEHDYNAGFTGSNPGI